MAMAIGTVSDEGTLAKALADYFEANIEGFDRAKGANAIEGFANSIVQYLKDYAVVTVTGVTAGSDTKTGTIL